MDYRTNISKVLVEKYGQLEYKSEGGLLLIGKAPHIAPQAWLHELYAPLNSLAINRMEEQLRISIPHVFRTFLTQMNGMNLYVSEFGIDGLREDYSRNSSVRLPFDILIPNLEERLEDAKPSYLFIGGYSADGSKLYIDTEDGTVHRCSKDSSKSLFNWDNFDQMISEELDRLVSSHDNRGVLLTVHGNRESSILDHKPTAVEQVENDIMENESPDEFFIEIPDELDEYSDEQKRAKYPPENRPQIVYGNKNGTVTIGISLNAEKIEKDDVPLFLHSTKEALLKTKVECVSDDFEEINGMKFAVLQFWSETTHGRVYNILCAASHNNKLVLVTFNFLEGYYKEWYDEMISVKNTMSFHHDEAF